MYKHTYICKLHEKKEIAPGIFDMIIISKEIAEHAKPGQFLHIRCGSEMDILMRRPISICDINLEKHGVRFIFQVKGEGTKRLSQYEVGDTIDILGPLGTSFILDSGFKNPLLIGGGIGVFPLLLLAKQLPSNNISICLGFRNKEMVVLEQDFTKACASVDIATDDGSYGYKGFVTQLSEEKIQQYKVDIIYACGPEPMLKGIKELSLRYNIPCQLSLEERMGCGIGACLVCACKIKKEDNWEYKHVCKDGPVFWADDIIFDK